MFRCAITGELSNPGEKEEIVVIEKRRKEYFGVKVKKKFKKKKPLVATGPQRKKKKTKAKKIDKGPIEKIGEGWEAVTTISVRKSTLKRLEQEGKQINCSWVK